MKKLFGCFLVICSLLNVVNAQVSTAIIGGDAAQLGGISAKQQSAYSAINNPALMPLLAHWQSGVYSEQRFGLKELTLSNISVVMPTKSVHIGAAINYFGFSNYNQQRFVLSAAKKLSESFSLGVQLNYQLTNIVDYGSAGAWVAGAGFMYKPTHQLTVSGFVFNPTQQKLSLAVADKIPSLFRLGVAYQVNDKVDVLAEGEQQLEQKINVRAGLRYQVHPRVGLGIGFNSNPVAVHFGTSIKFNQVMIDAAAGVHQVLGVIPQVGIRFPFKK